MGISVGGGQSADGIVFTVQSVSNTTGGSGGGIGYLAIAKSVGVEFDTWDNGLGLNDPNPTTSASISAAASTARRR